MSDFLGLHSHPPYTTLKLFAPHDQRAPRTAGARNSQRGHPRPIRPCPCLKHLFRVALCFFFTAAIVNWASASVWAGKKSSSEGSTTLDIKPQLVNVRTDPALRYPVMSESGMTIGSFSYGWLEISGNSVRYTVVEPPKRAEDGFDIPRAEVSGISFQVGPMLSFSTLHPERRGGRRYYWFLYVPQDRWGQAHTTIGLQNLQKAGAAGTTSMVSALSNFDDVILNLFNAPIWRGDLAKANALLKDTPDLALLRDHLGLTPLHWAAAGGHKDTVALLLANGADVNAIDVAGETPLHLAVNSNKDVVELLLASHADVNAQNKRGETAFYLAAKANHLEVAELLRQHGGLDKTPIETVFQNAARDGDLATVRQLLKSNPALVASKDYNGDTALHWAAAKGHEDIAALLLASGADVDARENTGPTPLHAAAVAGQKGAAKVLLANKASVNARNTDGATPLHLAALAGQIDMVELLREHGGEPLSDFSGARALDPALVGLIDRIVILPVVDARSDKSEAIDFQDLRGAAQKDLERDHYAVLQADSPPPGERWIMTITLAAFSKADIASATLFASLYDRQSEVVRWQAVKGGNFVDFVTTPPPTQPVCPGMSYTNCQLMNASGQAGGEAMMLILFRGKAKKWTLDDTLGELLGSLPHPAKEKK